MSKHPLHCSLKYVYVSLLQYDPIQQENIVSWLHTDHAEHLGGRGRRKREVKVGEGEKEKRRFGGQGKGDGERERRERRGGDGEEESRGINIS